MLARLSFAQISGATNVCEGATTGYAATPAGGTWSSSNPGVATVSSTTGVVTAISAGTAIITYFATPTVFTRTITVNPLPSPISAPSFLVCEGSTTTLSSAPAGGVWSTSEAAVAGVDISSGLVTASLMGTTVIQYTLSTMCARSVTVTVQPLPAAITGTATVCAGGNTTLANATTPGTWTSSATTVATVGTGSGLVAGIAAGTATISYQATATGCARTRIVTVNPLPTAFSGATGMCAGSFVTLASSPAGGTWSSGTPAVASVHAVTGVATGVAAGTSNITYTLPTGCYATRIQSVHPVPSAISGPSVVCPGSTIILTNTVSGGAWSSSNSAIATVSGTPGTATTVTGIAPGIATISYSTGTTCFATATVTVSPLPSAGVISGTSTICVGTTTTLSSTVAGGTWFCPSTMVSVASATGVVTGVTAGTVIVSYTTSGTCGTASTGYAVTVVPAPSVITGPTLLCAGTTATMVNATSGGTWASSSPTTATIVMGSGLLTGIASGITNVSYTMAPGCVATTSVTINPAPSPISGPDSVCVGSVIHLTDTAIGGVWSSSTPSVATVGVVGTASGAVLGIAPGTTIISYSLGSCSAFRIIRVNNVPSLTATLTPDACGPAYTAVASGASSWLWAPAGGVACATCGTTSIVPSGTTTYTVTGTNISGCSATATVTATVNRIYGHILFNYGTPTITDTRVWLVQYNPVDSTVLATDSLITCLDSSVPYFQFAGKPAGSYFLKARLLSATPGTSGYLPTYADSAISWFDATTITHGTGSDSQNIALKFGTVPSGPGFISGNVYSGAGRGTASDIPEKGMLIYLKDAITGQVLTYAYTNATGQYSFAGVGEGSYIIVPEEVSYTTIPSAAVSISATATSFTGISFRKHYASRTIYPYTTSVAGVPVAQSVSVFPNPASETVNVQLPIGVQNALYSITNITGQTLLSGTLGGAVSPAAISLSALAPGTYIMQVVTETTQFTTRLVVVAHP